VRTATWNINGLRARLEFVKNWLRESQPDLVGLQELKSGPQAVDVPGRDAHGRSLSRGAQWRVPAGGRCYRRASTLWLVGGTVDFQLSPLIPGSTLPTLVEPIAVGERGDVPLEVDLASRERRRWLRDALREHGALLFRGFDIADPERFAAVLAAGRLPLMDYPRGTSPRTPVGERIYTSTETRPDVAIPVHTEMSYGSVYPEAVAFCCVSPSPVGGATPLADMERVLGRLPAALVEEFERRRLRYSQVVPREATPALPKSWPEMFGSSDRSEVEAVCRALGIEATWFGDESLRIRNTAPAVRRHPVTGARVWFNQGDIFHVRLFDYLKKQGAAGAADEEARFRTDAAAGDQEPYWCTFEDGGEIDDELFGIVRRAIAEATVVFDWERGDLLLLDNFRVAHGRQSFEGERRILAALVERVSGGATATRA